MHKKRKTLVLLDGNALIHRAFHALPPMTTKAGESVNAVYGFGATLFAVLEKFKPDYIAASFDLHGPTFRDELYEDYKATRVAAPDDLYGQIPRVKELVQAFNIPIYEKQGFEADDCVGTLARQGEEKGVDVIIVTGDTDTLQLVTEHIKIFTLRKGIKDMVLLGPAEVKEKYGFPPERIVDYKGLAGDSSDNIPGVSGIGAKTATDLIQEFGSLEDIYASLDKVKPKVREKLEKDKKNAFLSKKLGTIDTNVPCTLELEQCVTHDFDEGKLAALLRELEFFSLLKKLPVIAGKKGTEVSSAPEKKSTRRTKLITTREELKKFLEALSGEIAIVVQEKEASLFGGGIESVGLAMEGKAAEVAWNDETEAHLKQFLSSDTRKVAHDWKEEWHRLDAVGAALSHVTHDIHLMAYVANPGSKVDQETLCEMYVGKAWPTCTLSEKASGLLVMKHKLEEKIEAIVREQNDKSNAKSVLDNLEMPLVPVLFQMEKVGITLEPTVFTKLSEEIERSLKKTEKEIYKFAGRDFNINSPRQLAEVLFGDLHIPTDNIKKNKTGYSTASTELDKLRADYPIISLIEEYRELFKLKTTYVDVLPGMVGSDGRLHTTYEQAVAATGRLSSMNPNLQNIPIRTELGQRMRQGFTAAPGKKLVGADYSQIELRIAAHLSGDKNMTEAFQKNEDIHRTTAALVHGIKPEEVTDAMRRDAKVLNFGIIYGMGAFGLSQTTKTDQKDAALFIKNYLKKFSGVAQYMEDMKKMAHEKGYVETELGRRRYLPEIKSGNMGLVRAAERMAINMPIQGLAADIMKLAMLDSRELLKKYDHGSALLLQIHDEIIFEVDESKAGAFAADLKEVMEKVYPLRVPLIVSVAIGETWEEI